jgi:hypothetical protein
MKQFQAIADANPSPADGHPSRNSGEPGYKASADYVAHVMKDAGYNVTIQQYPFTYYAYTGIPAFSQTSPTPQDFVLNTDWGPGAEHGVGDRRHSAAGRGHRAPADADLEFDQRLQRE